MRSPSVSTSSSVIRCTHSLAVIIALEVLMQHKRERRQQHDADGWGYYYCLCITSGNISSSTNQLAAACVGAGDYVDVACTA